MASRSRKKAKKRIVTSKNVVLEALVGMPLDIIFEIFGYLDPLDLLRLARTTKALRAILMSRSSLSLWKRVRHAYYQMPDGPEGMSEPQYASLAFDRICDRCGVSDNFVCTYWNAQLKSCFECKSALVVDLLNLKEKDFDFLNKLPSCLFVLLLEGIRLPYSSYSYSLEQVQTWSQEYASLSGSWLELTRKEWQCGIIEKNEPTKKHIKSFDLWTEARQWEMLAERERLIEATNKPLLVKLEELGWGEELSKMSAYERYDIYYTLLRKREVGTFTHAWSSKGRAIVKAIKARQAARIEKERQALLFSRYAVLRTIYDEYKSGLPADALILIPTVADVGLSPLVHAITTDERTDFIVTRQTFEDINLMQTLPSIVSDWKVRLDDVLIRMVRVELSKRFTKDQLLLATTVFYCDTCRMDLFYPQVLVHECPLVFRDLPSGYPAWNSRGNIKFYRNVHQAAIDIIDILGLDPKTVTAEDLIVSNRVLQCLDCKETHQGRMTMFWSRAIEHSRKKHGRLPSLIYWKVPGPDGQLALQERLAETVFAAPSDHSNSIPPRFMCGVCRQKGTHVGVTEHLLSAHLIPNPGEQDILFHPDAVQASMPCFLPETD